MSVTLNEVMHAVAALPAVSVAEKVVVAPLANGPVSPGRNAGSIIGV